MRIFGRDLTIACPPKEKNNLIKAAELLNNELEGITDKNNALIIAGLTLANKFLTEGSQNGEIDNKNISRIIKKIDKVLKN